MPRHPLRVDPLMASVGTLITCRSRHRTPDPDAYLTAARRLGVDPHRCVVVEDSPAGAAAGVAAGIPTVVVPGELEVERGPGLLHLGSHRELTLELLRSLDPQSPSSPFHPVQETRS